MLVKEFNELNERVLSKLNKKRSSNVYDNIIKEIDACIIKQS